MSSSTLKLLNNTALSKENAFLLDKIALELRSEYIDFISRLNSKYRNDVFWLMTDMSNRNTLNCDLFENLCRLELIKRLKKQKIKSIIVDNPFLYTPLKKITKTFLKLLTNQNIFSTILNFFLQFLKYLVYLTTTYF